MKEGGFAKSLLIHRTELLGDGASLEAIALLERARFISKGLKIDLSVIWGLMDPKASDWAFIVQANALVESALNTMLGEKLVFKKTGSNADLTRCIELLPLCGKASKVQMAKAAKLIDKGDEDLINKLASIRNFYAHDLRNAHKGIYDAMRGAEGKKSVNEFRKPFGLTSSWATFTLNPPQLRREIASKLFSQLGYWYVMS